MVKNNLGTSYFFYVFLFAISVCSTSFGEQEKITVEKVDTAIKNITYTESEFNPGAVITSNPSGTGFETYTNQRFDDGKKFLRRMITMRGEFYLDGSYTNKELSFYFGPTEYPYAFYLNQKLLFRHGSGGKDHFASYFEATDYQIPEGLLNYGGTNNVWIELYPSFETAPFEMPVLTDGRSSALMAYTRSLFNVHLVQCAELLGIFIGVFFLFRCISRKFEDKHYLYFSLMCIFFSLSYFNIFFNNNAANELLNEKITRASFPVAALFLTLFIREFTQYTNKKVWITILLFIAAASDSLAIFIQKSTDSVYWVFNNISSNFVITPFFIYSIVLLIYSYVKRRKKEYLTLLASYAVIIAFSFHDFYYFGRGITPYCWLVPYGYFILLANIFVILAVDEYNLFIESSRRTEEIRIKNESMEQVIRKIELASHNLILSSGNIEDNINKAVSVISDSSGRSRKMLQGMLKQLTSIEDLTKNIAARIDTAGDKIPKAILSQSAIVEETNRAVEKLNVQIEKNMSSALKTNATASELSNMALESKEIVLKSKESIRRISEYSNFLGEILSKIESIVEESNVLSINAAIESAHAGEYGKGFSIVAYEIRELAVKSKESLAESRVKLMQMSEFIREGLTQSEKVTDLLLTILEKAGMSAEMVNEISEGISWQKTESNSIHEGARKLLKDTMSIKELSEIEQNENEKIKTSLSVLKSSFEEISMSISSQSESEDSIRTAMEQIRNVLIENRKVSDILEETLHLAGQKQEA